MRVTHYVMLMVTLLVGVGCGTPPEETPTASPEESEVNAPYTPLVPSAVEDDGQDPFFIDVPNPNESAWEIIRLPDRGISFNIPPGWELTGDEGIYFVGPPEQPDLVAVGFAPVDMASGRPEAVEEGLRTIVREQPDLQDVSIRPQVYGINSGVRLSGENVDACMYVYFPIAAVTHAFRFDEALCDPEFDGRRLGEDAFSILRSLSFSMPTE